MSNFPSLLTVCLSLYAAPHSLRLTVSFFHHPTPSPPDITYKVDWVLKVEQLFYPVLYPVDGFVPPFGISVFISYLLTFLL